MNNDLIRRSDLKAAVDDICYSWGRETEVEGGVLIDLVEQLPAVDAEVVRHGRWDSFGVRRKDAKGRTRIEYMFNACTLCENPAHARTAYCPNCGAKMDAEVEG